MRGRAVGFGALALLVAGALGPASVQTPRTAVAPDTVRVGDVFRAAVRVEVPAGWRVALPDTLPVRGEVENAGRSARRDSTAAGRRRVTVVYPAAAWRPGTVRLPPVAVRLRGPDGAERSLEAAFSPVVVRSVLPEDTTGVEPRPEKGVLGPVRLLWPFVVGLLGLIGAGGGAAYWLYRRRGAGDPVPGPAPAPREQALAMLDEARSRGLVEAGEFQAFYAAISGAVRHVLAATDPRLGRELTTTELVDRLRVRFDPATIEPAVRVLQAADLVKFAGRRPAAEEATDTWHRARRWVQGFGAVPEPGAPEGDGDASGTGSGEGQGGAA